MSTELRRAVRRLVRQPGIALLSGGTRAPCVVLDLSAGGAKLKFDKDLAVPNELILQLSHTGAVRRRCKVAWRAAPLVGVTFVAD